jgi:hypothetical protein
MHRQLRSVLGFTLRVVGGTVCGTAAGAIAGLLLTAFNNLVLARGFDAAQSSYAFWAMFLGKLLLAPSVVGSIVWGVAFLRKRPRVLERRG